MEAIMSRDRAVVASGLVAISVLAWACLVYDARHMSCVTMMNAATQLHSWRVGDAAMLFLMWTIMMVGMMVPSVSPMVLTFAMVNRKRREEERPYVPTTLFLLGYLAVWTGFSGLATLAQWGLHAAALLSPMMVVTSPVLGAVLLVAAGIFQWTPLKRACLVHCRSPLGFILTEWRDGKRGAFIMGLRHGGYCVGCCWFLMGLLFVAGVMNLLWVAAISALVLAEKAAPPRYRVSWLAGGLLIGWGASMVSRVLR